jgi:hypothetical protein
MLDPTDVERLLQDTGLADYVRCTRREHMITDVFTEHRGVQWVAACRRSRQVADTIAWAYPDVFVVAREYYVTIIPPRFAGSRQPRVLVKQ